MKTVFLKSNLGSMEWGPRPSINVWVAVCVPVYNVQASSPAIKWLHKDLNKVIQ